MTDTSQNIWTLIEIRRYDEALQQIQEALTASPDNVDLLHASAYIAWMQDETTEGLALCEQGLALDPEHAEILYIQFHLLCDIEAFVEAEKVIISLLSQFPQNADYLSAYANLMLHTFHLDKARKLCDEALRIFPQHETAIATSYLLNIINNNNEVSDEELAKLVRQDPESEYLLSLIANDLIEKNQYRKAQSVAQELIQIDPHNEDYISSAIQLKCLNHWSSIPNWPFNRFGWPGSIALWLCLLIFIQVSDASSPWYLWVIYGYLAWVVYSWVQPPLLAKWLRYKGL